MAKIKIIRRELVENQVAIENQKKIAIVSFENI